LQQVLSYELTKAVEGQVGSRAPQLRLAMLFC